MHLVTSTTGGAAQAAIRLHEALLEANCNSRIFSVERRIQKVNSEIVKIQRLSASVRIASSTTTLIQQKLIQKTYNPVSPISLDLLDWDDPEIASADVLHLHAFYNLVSIRSFLKKYPRKKKVVTLHDERFYTGGCHNSMGCDQIATGCQNCPQVRTLFRPLVAAQRKNVLKLIGSEQGVTFICPSSWMLERAMSAFPDFPRSQFVQIYNPIPRYVTLTNPSTPRVEGINFGFISQSLDNPIKNLDLLLSAFRQMSKGDLGRNSLILVGESEKDYSDHNLNISQTVAASTNELHRLFSEIDVLVVPSSHDNLPNVLGEALMSGVGLIGSSAGGIPEIVKLFRQSLFINGDKEGLVQALKDSKLPDRSHIQEQASSVFGYSKIVTKMLEVYSSPHR